MSDHQARAGRFSGPLDELDGPDTLTARVVTAGDEPRIHGYDVERDLARYYRFSDQVLLSLTGELPTEAQSLAFDVALTFLAPVSVAHASTHAAVLARLCSAPTRGIVGVTAIGLSEQASFLLDGHADLLEWLASGTGPMPERHRARTVDEHAATDRLLTALEPSGLAVPSLRSAPTRSAALLMVLAACGLARREQMEAAIVLSRLATSLAEAFAERPTNFREYPANLPRFVYEEAP